MNPFLAYVFDKQKNWTVSLLKINTASQHLLTKARDEQDILQTTK